MWMLLTGGITVAEAPVIDIVLILAETIVSVTLAFPVEAQLMSSQKVKKSIPKILILLIRKIEDFRRKMIIIPEALAGMQEMDIQAAHQEESAVSLGFLMFFKIFWIFSLKCLSEAV